MRKSTPFEAYSDDEDDHVSATGLMDAQTYTLMRLGKRPLVVEGVELCMAMSFSARSPWWYEVNVYRLHDQRFAVAIKQFFQSDNERDIGNAWECETFGEVMDLLEGYDAAADVRVDVAPDDPNLSLPELAAHALAYRAKAEEARRQYASLIGEILYEMESA